MRLPLRNDLFRPPTLRSVSEGDRERHATWMELFGDLAVVAVIGQLGGVIKADFSLAGLSTYALLFIPVWWAWVGNTFYLSRFDSDDLIHRICGLIQIALFASLAINISKAAEGAIGGYVASYAALRLLLVVMYYFAGRHNPEVRVLTNSYVVGFGISALVWLSSILAPANLVLPIWALALLIDFLIPIAMRRHHVTFPPNESHLPERFGLFTIIVLGEAVLAAVVGTLAPDVYDSAPIIAGIALVVSFSIWWIYFEGVSASEIRLPYDKESAGRYQIWMYSHLPLHMAIVAGAIGSERAMHLKPGAAFPGGEGIICATVTFLIMVCMHSLYFSSLPRNFRMAALKRSWMHFAVTGLTAGVIPFADRMPGIVLVAVLAGLFLTHVLLTLGERDARIPKRELNITDYMAWWDGGR